MYVTSALKLTSASASALYDFETSASASASAIYDFKTSASASASALIKCGCCGCMK